ncbi:MAG: DUF1385 domain-containing protein [Actinobacteria bacterium]|nr:MAG: DUF1385 domain-containing protein [Actinomycetota bacterium]
MMRAPTSWAVAVRRPDGVIEAQRNELPALTSRSRAARVPFVRGVLVLVEALTLGFRALSWSAQKAGDEEEQLSRWQVVTTMVVAVGLAIGLFIIAPALGAGFLKQFVGDHSIAFVVIDGLLRIMLIVGYIWLIGRSPDVRRVFQYHGAEHKTIHAYESGKPLGIEHIQAFSPRHPRCGTSFIIIVAMVAFFVFLFLAPAPFWWQVLGRLLLIPVIAGASYEVLKAAAGHRWLAWASRPGIWIQAITTGEPSDDMVEVAVVSLLAALDREAVGEVKLRGAVAPAALLAEVDDGDGDG